jgi:molecular chaperone HtpG
MTRHSRASLEDRRRKEKLVEVPCLAPEDVFIGKDVLELVTTAMHVDPITLYREYVQNAADAVDEARRCGLLGPLEPGKVNIDVEPTTRSVRIRDNGVGVPWSMFVQCLTTIGASSKRGTPARGFRGVGRLAGLGYAQELIFRSRVAGEDLVSELRWDGRSLKSALRNAVSNGGISDLVRSIVSAARIESNGYPERFFEVELKGIIRLGSDKLLNPTAIAEYLAQVAPVPFAPDFRFGAEITTALHGHLGLGELELHVSGVEGPIYRPHRNSFAVDSKRVSLFEKVELVEIPSVDGQVAAIAWILHHGYEGAVPLTSLIRGLRLRCGNLQVGGHALLEEIFPEERFNAWSVGEIHVIDQRIVPNGRRDNFEQDVHFNNLLNQLTPIARSIARRCRVSSRKRHLLRQFAFEEATARDRLSILAQGALSSAERNNSARSIQQGIGRMEKIIGADDLVDCEHSQLEARITAVRAELQRLMNEPLTSSPLGHLPVAKRKMYEHLFGLVYECSTNRVAAKALVDRILIKLQDTEKRRS